MHGMVDLGSMAALMAARLGVLVSRHHAASGNGAHYWGWWGLGVLPLFHQCICSMCFHCRNAGGEAALKDYRCCQPVSILRHGACLCAAAVVRTSAVAAGSDSSRFQQSCAPRQCTHAFPQLRWCERAVPELNVSPGIARAALHT